jgi:hypothetical protein
MTFGACRTLWACLAIIVGLTIPAAGDSAAPIELVHGGRLPGRVIEMGDPAVVCVAAEMFAEPIEFVAAAVLQDGEAAAAPPRLPGLPGRVGLLTSGAARLLGCLAAGADGQLAWQPLGATRPVAFANTAASASIDYVGLDVVGGPGIALSRQGRSGDWTVVDMIADGPAARDGRLRVDERVATIAEGAAGKPVDLATAKADAVRLLLVGPVGSMVRLGVSREAGTEEIVLVRDLQGRDDLAGAAAKDVLDRALAVQQTLGGQSTPRPATVHLITGESFACEVLGADEQTVRVGAGDRGELVIPGDSVRALELSSAGVRPILKQKLARLLTVPRTQQASPPTHVLRMAGGDYLRGRLVGIDAETVRFDMAGEVKPLPRRDVARVIRLATSDESPPHLRAALANRDGLPLVVVGGDGRRQAIAATGLRADAVVGDSPVLGPTTVPLAGAVKVLLGDAIEEASAAEPLPYAQWVRRPAAAAKASSDGRIP